MTDLAQVNPVQANDGPCAAHSRVRGQLPSAVGRQVIVTLPEQIDVSHADQVSKSLLGVINRRRARCHLVYPANDDAGRPTAPGRQTNVAPACGSFCNWPVLSR